ncbi:MAG: HEAT repeat domain-containing protein [Parachlamydiaceae bacterium]|nr:HEAT repeat domain-containing protein [Parachlamydiaceae bacterium]
MNNTDLTRSVQITLNTSQNKSLYGDGDQRLNLHELDSIKLDQSFISTVKKQAESIACLVHKDFLIEKGAGWQFHPGTPTLSQSVERQFQPEGASFGEQEAFKDELAPGFGTAFLLGKRLALTAAHCICEKDSNTLDEKVIQQTRLIFGFHEIKAKPSDYFFAKNKVYQIKKVVAHQFIRLRDKNHNYTEWTDWALLELTEEVPFTPLRMNMTEKVADKLELYMLGHPSGLPLKFTGGGFIQGNTHKDFFECNLDAFGGNSGSFIAAISTQMGSGMLCSGCTDYEITDNYKNKGKRKIQACRITKSQIAQNIVGNRLENCQRIDTLRFLVSPELLGLEVVDQQNSSALIVKSLQDNYKSRNTIPRLMYSALPIEDVYTELVLLEQSKEQDKNDEKAAFEEHRINSWEDVHGTKKPIELKNLFNNDGKEQKKLLILGRAGIGKSILCQFIAYQWAKTSIWPGKFDALFWVPLRKLQHAHSVETTASFLFRTCCQEHGSALYPKDIADYILQHKERILFVLDGLDEVTLEEDSLQKTIVDELLAFPHWILTSRPHAATSIRADATIENVGFATNTIEAYIQKSFPKNSQGMIQKVRQNPTIFGLCHIPINLELVCSILQKSKGDISNICSMAGLYEELTLILQRLFLDKLGKPSAWHWEPEDIKDDAEISLAFKSLESMAWEGMREKALFFSFNQGAMRNIYCNSYPSSQAEKREPLFKNMCASGFLQSTGDNEQFLLNEYSFLHLTFQEFFAARYLVRLLYDNPKEAAKCMQEVKFNPRYKIVMGFVAGLLRKEGGEFHHLNAFFSLLDTPKDSIGLYETLLKVRCLEECGWQKKLHNLHFYEQNIHLWCQKMDLNKWDETSTCPLTFVLEFTVKTFKSMMQQQPLAERSYDPLLKHLMETFEISPQGAKQFLIPMLSSYTSDQNKRVRTNAIHMLGRLGLANPEWVLPLLIDTLKDKESVAAISGIIQIGDADPQRLFKLLDEATKNNGPLITIIPFLIEMTKNNPERFLSLLTNAIQGENKELKALAILALGRLGENHPKLVLPLMSNLMKNEDKEIRGCAAFSLGFLNSADPQWLFPLLTDALKDEDASIRMNALKGLDNLIQLHAKLIFPLLTNAMEDSDESIRELAIRIFRNLEEFDLDCIECLLTDAQKHIIVFGNPTFASKLLGTKDPEIVLPILSQLLKHQDKKARLAAIYVLRDYLDDKTDPEIVIPLLVNARKDIEEDIKVAAIEALGKFCHANPKLILPMLAKALKSNKNRDMQEAAAGALGIAGHADPQFVLPLFVDFLKNHHWWSLRNAATNALGKLGHADPQFAIPLLAISRNDKDKRVKQTAVNALVKYDLSSYLKSYPNLLYPCKKEIILYSTPLSALITCYQEDLSQPSVYCKAIAMKCIEENLSLFQEENFLCFYEQGKLCKVKFPNVTEALLEIEKQACQYDNKYKEEDKEDSACSVQ